MSVQQETFVRTAAEAQEELRSEVLPELARFGSFETFQFAPDVENPMRPYLDGGPSYKADGTVSGYYRTALEVVTVSPRSPTGNLETRSRFFDVALNRNRNDQPVATWAVDRSINLPHFVRHDVQGLLGRAYLLLVVAHSLDPKFLPGQQG